MRNPVALLAGLGVGAGVMFLLDPGRGRRRRALIADQLAHAWRLTGDCIDATSQDMEQRAVGVAARVRRALRQERVDDVVLAERVRAKLGRFVSHPRAVEVDVAEGVVTLRGAILEHEAKRLLRALARIRGVRNVVAAFEEHAEPRNVPALQGGRTRTGSTPELWQKAWSPTTRVVTGAMGLTLAGYGASRRDAAGSLITAAGVGLLTRAATNLAVSS